MKKIFFLLIFSCFAISLWAQDELWTVGNARTVDAHSLHVSLFQNTRYGINRTLEIGAQPIGMFLMPNIYAKKQWYKSNLLFTTRHGIYVPVIGMKSAQASEKKFPAFMDSPREIIFPQTNQIKTNLTFTNELLISSYLQKPTSCVEANYLLTAKFGFHFATANKNQVLDTIFYPVLFTRSQVYHKNLLWYLGVQLDGHLYFEELDFSADLQMLALGRFKDWAFEHKGLLLITHWENTRLLLGYKLAYASLATQPNRLSFLPLIDFTYTFKFKAKAQGGDVTGIKRGKSPRKKKDKD